MDKLSIAKRLRSSRELAGLSQGQAAKLLKMHRPTISEIEAGRRNVLSEEITKFAEIYGVQSAWILEGEDAVDGISDEIYAAARELSEMSEADINKLLSTIKIIKSKGNAAK